MWFATALRDGFGFSEKLVYERATDWHHTGETRNLVRLDARSHSTRTPLVHCRSATQVRNRHRRSLPSPQSRPPHHGRDLGRSADLALHLDRDPTAPFDVDSPLQVTPAALVEMPLRDLHAEAIRTGRTLHCRRDQTLQSPRRPSGAGVFRLRVRTPSSDESTNAERAPVPAAAMWSFSIEPFARVDRRNPGDLAIVACLSDALSTIVLHAVPSRLSLASRSRLQTNGK